MFFTVFSSLLSKPGGRDDTLTARYSRGRARQALYVRVVTVACQRDVRIATSPSSDDTSGASQHFPRRDAAGWKAARKRAALALDAGHFEPAAVALQRVLDYGEAETRAPELSRPAGIDAIETLGQPRQVLGRDPDARIAKLDARAALVDPPAHIDAAVGGRIFGCVGEQVREDRMQLGLRAQQHRIRVEGDQYLRRWLGPRHDVLAHQCGHPGAASRRAVGLFAGSLRPRQPEQVVDDAPHPFRRPAHFLHRPMPAGAGRRVS